MVYVSVIVPSIGRESLAKCLSSLQNQTFDDFETIVVGTTQKCRRIVERFPDVRFAHSSFWNNAYQKNLGVKLANGKIVAFIDDDSLASPRWLEFLIRHYKRKEVACVGGKIDLLVIEELPAYLKKLPYTMVRGFLGQTLLSYRKAKVLKDALLWGSNISFRKETFLEVGGFEIKLGRTITSLESEEERSLQMKLIRKGYKIIYEPRSVVRHLVPQSRLTKEYFIRRAFWQGYSEAMRTSTSCMTEVQLLEPFLLSVVSKYLLKFVLAKDFSERLRIIQRIGRIVGLFQAVRNDSFQFDF